MPQGAIEPAADRDQPPDEHAGGVEHDDRAEAGPVTSSSACASCCAKLT
jgi:hypothetical protein